MGILDRIPNGQQRTAWLGDAVGDFMTNITPPNLRPAVEFAAQMNPIQGMSDSMSQFGVATDSSRTPEDRRQAAFNSALEGLFAVAPAGLAAKGYMTPAQGTLEGLLGWSPAGQAVGDELGRFWADEAGNIRVWHGSPHDFDKFSMDNIGTGEGAQAYGHGLYFAENPDVARGYRSNNSATAKFSYDGTPITDELEQSVAWSLAQHGGDKSAVRDEWRGMFKPEYFTDSIGKDQLEILDRMDFDKLNQGHIYEVNIDANPEDFLDWDSPVAGQPALENFRHSTASRRWFAEENPTGGELYRDMENGGRPAYESLNNMGIRGITYLDQGSRAAGDGTRNYVAFDDSLLSILSKDGVPTDPISQRGDEILGLLQSNPASVTDEMLDMGDAVSNARLNDYLFRNYDLPMDQASRMARAKEMGFGGDLYHGTGADVVGFDLDMGTGKTADTGVFLSNRLNAETYAPYKGGQIIPVRSASNAPIVSAEGSVWNRIESPVYALDTNKWEDIELIDDFGEASTDDIARAARSQGLPSVSIEDVSDRGPRAWGFTDYPSHGNVRVEFDPTNIRSRFARFDPRLSHLKNLSAGLGAAGLFGLLSPQAEQQGGI